MGQARVIVSRISFQKPLLTGPIQFVKDEINKDSDQRERASHEFRQLLAKVSQELSFFDWLRICKFINKTSSRKREQLALKKERTFKWLDTSQNGDPQLQHENIFNLANIELTEVEKDLLCRGLRFGIPPGLIKNRSSLSLSLLGNKCLMT